MVSIKRKNFSRMSSLNGILEWSDPGDKAIPFGSGRKAAISLVSVLKTRLWTSPGCFSLYSDDLGFEIFPNKDLIEVDGSRAKFLF